MNILLSIIVPVYNVEKYIRQCIDSLLTQDISKDSYEIVLIDDGSTDKSGLICDEYAAKNDNIRVYHQKNAGLSASRNIGIEIANGLYVQFVDSDDFIEQNSLKRLLNQVQAENLDVLRFNYENVDESGHIIHPYKNPKLYSDYSDSVTTGADFLLSRLGLACYSCQFILKKDLALLFPFMRGIHFEDTEWVTRLFPEAKRVSSTDSVAYYYRIREGSITKARTIEAKRKNIADKLFIISVLRESGFSQHSPSWYDRMISLFTMSVLGEVSQNFYTERRLFIKELKEVGAFPVLPYSQSIRGKMRAFVINHCPNLFCSLLHLMNNK